MWEIPKHFFRKSNREQLELKPGIRQKDEVRLKKAGKNKETGLYLNRVNLCASRRRPKFGRQTGRSG